jgi:3-hydroxyacyl-CoA dehydrogenase
MGTGIGIVASRVAGCDVAFIEPKEAGQKRSRDFIAGWCDKEIAKDRMKAAEKDALLAKITYHDSV